METRKLGTSTLEVSVIGLGCNNFGGRIDPAGSRRVIDAAIDKGINFFDTADIYADTESETVIGDVLGARRDKIVLATKFGKPIQGSPETKRGSRSYIVRAVDASLQRLKTGHIDLYQMHEPDAETPIEETLGALEELVQAGKIRYYGASNFSPEGLAAAQAAARKAGQTGFVTSQDEYSLVVRDIEAGLLPVIEREKLALIPFFPLASGLLTGKYRGGAKPEDSRFGAWTGLGDRYLTARNIALVEAFDAFARERGHTLLELAFGWLLSHPVVPSVIAGATKPEQIEANVAAAGWRLGAADLAAFDAIGKAIA
ncbi:aldo/keto reductase [Kaistia dalseonensis]|uniref:Aryl-alcohol dehydrogenase-like predicted oxidoreductase n=1 Tax=Kaistia dalseonensis TaxID=410840 RepID=A0ABU0H495_9HYPH|nr:aldo/keto reductase [Kaistia dalseonensis]MCX5494543.1 aldo/keto reductase [Kaistia dalseonensis]MDQ0437123.1 aryl-alcohol dehydrogenase-like predicted oxidoreductase [Kaistia dalseonensis]